MEIEEMKKDIREGLDKIAETNTVKLVALIFIFSNIDTCSLIFACKLDYEYPFFLLKTAF